jgi:Swt1-like HEPN
VNLDVQALIRIATDRQHQILYNATSPRERNFLHELRDVRNRHAHQNVFDERDVERALDTLELFLKAIRSPDAAGVMSLRRPATPQLQTAAAILKPAMTSTPTVVKSGQLSAGVTGMQRGVRLFRHLAQQANHGKAVGIAYGDFIAFLHGKPSFREVAGRNYLPGDSGAVIALAWAVTEESGGRITVTSGGREIRSGMDTFIWSSNPPYDRPERAFSNPKCSLPYSRADWKAVFPDGRRRMIEPGVLAGLG